VIGSVIGNYVVKQLVGEGGMGAVYLAEHPRLGRKVAIKLLHANLNKKADIVSRFFVEAKAATDIGSDHIVGVLDFGELADGQSYLILEWLEGRSLGQLLGDEKKLPLVRAIHIARGVARALAAAHAIGIVHRDLKPDNVFLVRKEDDPEFVKVLDFGIAKLLDNKTDSLRVKTETGALIGTPAYMSPEQCRGADKVDQRTDIYALAVIFYEMVTGRLPFEAQGLGELLIAHMTQTPPSLRSIDASIPQSIDDAIEKALAKDPDARFQKIDAFVDALSEAWTASGPIRTGVMPAAAGVHEARSPQSTLTRTAAEMMPADEAPAPRRMTAVAAIVGVAAIAAAAAVALRHRAQEPTTTTTTIAQAPPANPSAPIPPPTNPTTTPTNPPATNPTNPTTNSAGAGDKAKLVVRATPAGAQLVLDGDVVANPLEIELSKNGTHELVARAPGYKTQTRSVTLDGDRALTLALVKADGGKPQAQKTPATEPHPPTTPATKDDGKTIYKGTKGTLITDFPEK
jgi:eukaryotic-like serine/threonine-protein kinase